MNLLSASGIGIYQELVHALAYEHIHRIRTHESIESVSKLLHGWVLFTDKDTDAIWQTYPLWSTLYLREIALQHVESQA